MVNLSATMPHPTFLRVTYDRQLTFSRHAALVGNSLKRQAGILRNLANTSGVYDRQTIRTTYIATAFSKEEYVTYSWQSWISNSTFENKERSQRYAVRAITGQLHATPVDAVLAEANLTSIKRRAIQLCTVAVDKSLRTTPINPRHTTATQLVRQSTQKPSWREKNR